VNHSSSLYCKVGGIVEDIVLYYKMKGSVSGVILSSAGISTVMVVIA